MDFVEAVTSLRGDIIMNILIVETDNDENTVIKELVTFLSKKDHFRTTKFHLPGIIEVPRNMVFSNLQISINEQTVYLNNKELHLSRYEFFTLCFLANHPNWVFSKEQIYEAVWNEAGEHCGTAVTNVISQIRRKLKQSNPDAGYIHTVVGMGYKFEEKHIEGEK